MSRRRVIVCTTNLTICAEYSKAMRIELNYESVYQACRSMVRKMGHFARFERVIRTGLRYINTPFAEQPWA